MLSKKAWYETFLSRNFKSIECLFWKVRHLYIQVVQKHFKYLLKDFTTKEEQIGYSSTENDENREYCSNILKGQSYVVKFLDKHESLPRPVFSFAVNLNPTEKVDGSFGDFRKLGSYDFLLFLLYSNLT